jgi:hypothetical protein
MFRPGFTQRNPNPMTQEVEMDKQGKSTRDRVQ